MFPHSKNTATIQNSILKTLEEMNHPESFGLDGGRSAESRRR